jgi:WD40 repeat protein
VAVGLTIFAFNQRGEAQSSAATAQAEAFARATQQMVAELEANQRATQQAVAEEETRARSTAEAIAVEERDKVLRQASVALADRATKMKDLGDPELAVLLTLAALENYPYTPEAEQALAESVLEVPTSKLVPGDRNSSWLAVDWSPTTDLVATALFGEYREPTILIQDPQNGSEVITIPMGVDCYGASNIAWSPLGDRLITVPRYCDYAPRIFDATSGELITTLASQPEQANFAAAWAPDGKFILTGSLDGFARIWDVKTGEMVLAIPAHENYITEVAWSPTGDAFATGSNDDTVKAWKAKSGELQFVFNHTDDVAGLDWSPGGENIVIAGLDGTAKVLDGQTGELFMSLAGHMDQVWDAAWSPNGAIIATDSRDGLTRFWDASTAKELFRYPNYLEEQLVLNSIDWSPDGKRVLIMGVEFNQVWDLTSKSQARQSHSRGLTDAKWSPDGQFLATGSLDNTVRIWDSVDNALVVIFDHPESILNLSWSPDSLQLAATDRDGSIRVWDVDSQSFQKMPDQERIKFTDLAWSPNGGRIIATSEFDQVGMIWDVDSGETISLEQGELRCFLASPSWSPEGDRIVTGCVGELKDTPARLWDAEKGTELERFHSVGGVSQVVSWSQNGKFIAVGYSEPVAQIWDAVTLQPVLRFGNHSDKIVDLNFAPNSQRVVSIDAGRYMLVWDVETGSVVHSMRSSNTPTSVDWHPFGTHVIATTIDTEPDIKPVWQSTQDLISYAELCCARGELNEDQRKAFGLPLD